MTTTKKVTKKTTKASAERTRIVKDLARTMMAQFDLNCLLMPPWVHHTFRDKLSATDAIQMASTIYDNIEAVTKQPTVKVKKKAKKS